MKTLRESAATVSSEFWYSMCGEAFLIARPERFLLKSTNSFTRCISYLSSTLISGHLTEYSHPYSLVADQLDTKLQDETPWGPQIYRLLLPIDTLSAIFGLADSMLLIQKDTATVPCTYVISRPGYSTQKVDIHIEDHHSWCVQQPIHHFSITSAVFLSTSEINSKSLHRTYPPLHQNLWLTRTALLHWMMHLNTPRIGPAGPAGKAMV